MTDSPSTESKARRRRWISFGETVGVIAVSISALGLWNSWRSDQADKPAPQVEAKTAIPVAFRGRVESDGKAMTIAPVEPGHALESLTLSVAGKPAISIGSDGRLAASQVQALVGAAGKDPKAGTLNVRLEARYIESGRLRRGGGRYRISYRWDDGGLFGGDKPRLTGLSHG
jgi:hypothetical protein